jgi:hypothetical protein
MKQMNELELQLRSWVPRPPSAKLSQKLFARPQSEEASSATEHGTRNADHAPFSFRWLVPASAALLLVCLIFNQHSSAPITGGARSEPMIAMITSNQSTVPYFPSTFQKEQNSLLTDTFEWTNGSGSTSSISSLSPSKGSN